MRGLAVLILFVLPGGIFAAELSKDERKTRSTIENVLRSAGRNYSAGKFDQAGTAIRRAMTEIDAAMIDGTPDLFDALQPAIRRIKRAHTLLEFEGVSLPPFRVPNRPIEKMNEESSAKPSPDEISFSKRVAPILVRRCGRCHISGSKGKFSMATFTALMKGPPVGVVIFAGDIVGSRLIEIIESGDMPRGGGKVMPQELLTLKAWIQTGAKFDGEQPDASIGGNAIPTPATNPKPMVRQPTGKETVSFSKDVAPLLIDNCKGCHLQAITTRGGLRIDTFSQLLRGGDSGAPIQSGNGEASLLIKKLKGTEGQRMPAGGRPPLSEESINLIAKWIDEGAVLDGASASQPLTVMSQLAWAASATSGEISERRQSAIERNLKLAITSGGKVQSKATENFLVIGPVPAETIDLVAEQAENQMKLIATVLPPSDTPVYRGRATIVVLPKRYDYSEFSKMIEQRGLPSDWTSHWKFDGIDAYVAVVASARDDASEIAGRLTPPLVSLAVATLGSGVPHWLADGVGAVATEQKSGRRDRKSQQKQEAELIAAVSAMKNAKQFLDSKLTPEQTDRTGKAIAASMLEGKSRRGYDKMVRALAGGIPFEQAFITGYGMPIEQYVDRWKARWSR